MNEPVVLHQRIHSVSHFQVFLMDRDVSDGHPDYGHGSSLATFSPHAVAVSTAWDDNGTVEPHVEIIVTGFGAPAEPADGLKPVADGQIGVARGGIQVGNAIANDLHAIPVPEGRYVVTVYTDTLAPFTARRVRFHLMRL